MNVPAPTESFLEAFSRGKNMDFSIRVFSLVLFLCVVLVCLFFFFNLSHFGAFILLMS